MQGEPAHLQRLSVEGGAQDTQHARAEACPAKHIYPSDCVGSDVWMAQQVRPTLPDPAYRTDRQQVVAYLLAADNGSGPLPFRLRCVNQPVISTPKVFSSTRSPLLGCIRAHFSCSTPRSSTSARF